MSGWYGNMLNAETFGWNGYNTDITRQEYREPQPARFVAEHKKAVNDAWEYRQMHLHAWLLEQWEAEK